MHSLSWPERPAERVGSPFDLLLFGMGGAPIDVFDRDHPVGGTATPASANPWTGACFKQETIDPWFSLRGPFYGDPESTYRPAVPPDGRMAKTAPEDTPSKRDPARRTRNMSDADVDRIVLVVRHWPKAPMTWEAIRTALAADLGRAAGRRGKPVEAWTRQALSANSRIKDAYAARRLELATKGTRKRKPTDPEATLLRQRVETLGIELRTLRAENEALLDRFRALLTNRASGRPEAEIEAPLPAKIDRTDRKG